MSMKAGVISHLWSMYSDALFGDDLEVCDCIMALIRGFRRLTDEQLEALLLECLDDDDLDRPRLS